MRDPDTVIFVWYQGWYHGMNDDDLAAFVRHVTHRDVPRGASQAELLAILAKRYAVLEYAIEHFHQQLNTVMASIKAVIPKDRADEEPGRFVCGGFNCPCADNDPCPDPSCTCTPRKEQPQPSTA